MMASAMRRVDPLANPVRISVGPVAAPRRSALLTRCRGIGCHLGHRRPDLLQGRQRYHPGLHVSGVEKVVIRTRLPTFSAGMNGGGGAGSARAMVVSSLRRRAGHPVEVQQRLRGGLVEQGPAHDHPHLAAGVYLPAQSPPPSAPTRRAQNRSGCSISLAVGRRPSAVTTSAERRLSIARPCLRPRYPIPRPGVSPAIPPTPTSPKGVASPCS